MMFKDFEPETIREEFELIFMNDLIVFLRDYDEDFMVNETPLQSVKLSDVLKDYYRHYFFPKKNEDDNAPHILPIIFNVASGQLTLDGQYTDGRYGFPPCSFGFYGQDTEEKIAKLESFKQKSFYMIISGLDDGDYYFNETKLRHLYEQEDRLITDLGKGHFDDIACILKFDLAQRHVTDVSEHIAAQWFEYIFDRLKSACVSGEKTHDDVPEFIQHHHKKADELWRRLPMPKSMIV